MAVHLEDGVTMGTTEDALVDPQEVAGQGAARVPPSGPRPPGTVRAAHVYSVVPGGEGDVLEERR